MPELPVTDQRTRSRRDYDERRRWIRADFRDPRQGDVVLLLRAERGQHGRGRSTKGPARR